METDLKKMNDLQNVDYFIDKFTSIPKKYWTIGNLREGNKKCALGHCGVVDNVLTPESKVLGKLYLKYLPKKIADIILAEDDINERILMAVAMVNDSYGDIDSIVEYFNRSGKINTIFALRIMKERILTKVPSREIIQDSEKKVEQLIKEVQLETVK